MIKNLIFDLGDVLMSYRATEMLMDYGMTEKEALYLDDLMFYDPLWAILDKGTMTNEEVIAGYAKKYPKHADAIGWFIRHGEYMHVPRPKVWEKVHELKEKGYRIYLLSNYSKDFFQKHTKDASFVQDLDGAVISYQIHETKPDAAIYEHLLKKYQLNPAECLFFDDRAENVEGAVTVGIAAKQVESQEHLLEMLDKL